MIIEAVLGVIVGLIEWLVSIFPTFGLDLSEVDIASAVESVATAAAALDGWAPVDESLVAFASLLTLQVAISAWGLLVWVYHQFWGSS